MKKKYLFITLLLMAVGFAAVSTTLLINGTSLIKKNTDDFKVYYSSAKVNGVEDSSVVVDDTHLSFKTTLDALGQTYVLDYDVTNSSKNYDAALTMNCTGGNEYLTVINLFNTSDNLLATETRSGKLTLTLAKSYTGNDLDVEIECTINANAVERNSLGIGIPADPVEGVSYKIGDEIQIANEKFNIIAIEDGNLRVLAQKGLDSNYLQSDDPEYVQFETSWAAWEEDEDGNIILDSTGGPVKTYVANYVNYLKNETGDNTITGTIITFDELENLGCIYDNVGTYVCQNSQYITWLKNDQYSWVRTRHDSVGNWVFITDGMSIGGIEYDYYCNGLGFENEECEPSVNAVRPVITISIGSYETYKGF